MVFLNFLLNIFSIKFYTISFLCKHNFFIDEKHTQWTLNTKVKLFHESNSCFMKLPWNCISWNALKEKFHGVSFPFEVSSINWFVVLNDKTFSSKSINVYKKNCFHIRIICLLDFCLVLHNSMSRWQWSIADWKLKIFTVQVFEPGLFSGIFWGCKMGLILQKKPRHRYLIGS